jgi:type VI secretion system protein ImpH
MASAQRSARDPLIARLEATPGAAEFHRAVELLHAAAGPDAAPIGGQGPVAKERIRFRGTLDLAFHASDVTAITPLEDGGHQVDVGFLGLYGTSSPLPAYFTEHLLHADDPEVERGFLDLFHQRLLSLMHRGWAQQRIELTYRGDGSDVFSQKLLAFAGLSGEALAGDQQITAGRLLGQADVLGRQVRSLSQIEALIDAWFPDVQITIEPFLATWIPVPADQRNRMGQGNCTLGSDLTMGAQVLDRTCAFGLTIGPMPLDTCLRFLPSGDLMTELRELLALVNTDQLDYRIDLLLEPAEVPKLVLEGLFSTDQTRLGWSTWLGSSPAVPDPITFHSSSFTPA